MLRDKLIFKAVKSVIGLFAVFGLILAPAGFAFSSPVMDPDTCCQAGCHCCQMMNDETTDIQMPNCDCEMNTIPDTPDFPKAIVSNANPNPEPDALISVIPESENNQSEHKFFEDYNDVLLASNSPPLFILNSSFII
jgi:hypothetical protein